MIIKVDFFFKQTAQDVLVPELWIRELMRAFQ